MVSGRRIFHVPTLPSVSAKKMRQFHLALTVLWFLMMPLAIYFGWVASVVFISVISIYANFVGHFSSWQASRAEEAQERRHSGG